MRLITFAALCVIGIAPVALLAQTKPPVKAPKVRRGSLNDLFVDLGYEYRKVVKLAGPVDSTLFGQMELVTPGVATTTPLEQYLDSLCLHLRPLLKWTKDGDRYIVDYVEPLVRTQDIKAQKSIGGQLAAVYKAWGKPMPTFKGHADALGIVYGYREGAMSVSVVLKRLLDGASPPLHIEVRNGVESIVEEPKMAAFQRVTTASLLGPIVLTEYSEDGQRMVTNDANANFVFWDAEKGEILSPGHGTVAENGLKMPGKKAIFSLEKSIREYDFETGEQRSVATMDADISAIACAPRAGFTVAGDVNGQIGFNWMGKTSETIASLGIKITHLTISEDGRNLAFVVDDGKELAKYITWVVGDGLGRFDFAHARPRKLPGKLAQIRFNPDGNYLGAVTEDGTLTYYTANDYGGASLWSKPLNVFRHVRFCFDPTGQYMIYTYNNSTLRKVELATKRIADIGTKALMAQTVQTATTSKTVVSGGKSKRLSAASRAKLLAMQQQQAYQNRLGASQWNITSLTCKPGSDESKFEIALATDAPDTDPKRVFVYGNKEGQFESTPMLLTHESGAVKNLAFSPDGSYLVVEAEGAIRFVKPSMDSEPRTFVAPVYAISPEVYVDGVGVIVIVLADESKTSIRRWNASSKGIGETQDPTPCNHRFGQIKEIKFSGDGKRFLVRDLNGEITVWNRYDSKPFITVPGRYTEMQGMAINGDGTRVGILVGGKQGSFSVFDTASGQLVVDVKNDPTKDDHTKFVGPLLAPSIGNWMAFVEDTKVRVVSTESDAEVFSVPGAEPAISADGRFIAVQDAGLVRIYNNRGGLVNWIPGYHPKIGGDGTKVIVFDQNQTKSGIADLATNTWSAVQANRSAVTATDVHPLTGLMATGYADGTIMYWRPNGTSVLDLAAKVTFYEDNEFFVETPKSFYSASPGAASRAQISYKGQKIPADQFDLAYNRPDKVYESIGLMTSDQLKEARQVSQKRLQQLHVDEKVLSQIDFGTLRLPEITIREDSGVQQSNGAQTVSYMCDFKDLDYPLKKYVVSVNGVPILEGDLQDHKLDYESVKIGPIELSPDTKNNVVRLSLYNTAGIEARETRRYTTNVNPNLARDLYVVSVGVSDYSGSGYKQLLYPDDDARAMAKLFDGLDRPGIKYVPVQQPRSKRAKRKPPMAVPIPAVYNKVHIHEPLVDAAATKENILKIRDFLKDSKPEDMVILSFAGHGDVQGGNFYFVASNAKKGELIEKGISISDIDGLFDGVRARNRLVLIDACHSGETEVGGSDVAIPSTVKDPAMRARGAKLNVSQVFQKARQSFANFEVGSGATIICAAVGEGSALEKDGLQNGFFTKAVIEAISGSKAIGADGKTRVSSLRKYIYKRVNELSEGDQVPTVRRQNLDLDFVIR